MRRCESAGLLARIPPKRLVSAVIAVAVLFSQPGTVMAQSSANSSLLLLIDVSGSMSDPIGNGNPEIKINAAKQAAVEAIRLATRRRTTEVSVLAFEGSCSHPVSRFIPFTSDVDALERFVRSLRPGGGTPMAEAVKIANRFMKRESAPTARDQMIVLLADGQNDCGNVLDAMEELNTSGVVFRHETVGFGIEPNSNAANDLRNIATATDGTYHHAADATQLGDVLAKSIDTFTVIDMLGTFGGAQDVAGGRSRSESLRSESGQLTDMIGLFKPTKPVEAVDKGVPPDDEELCYRKFTNPSGLDGLRNQFEVTEFTCAASCELLRASFPSIAKSNVNVQGLTCPEKCAYAAGTSTGASHVWGRARDENHCVSAIGPLRPPASVTHYYCDYKDNRHQVVWQSSIQPAGGYRIYLNGFPDINEEAEFLGTTTNNSFEFEYGTNFRDDPVVDGLNLWDPFPTAGISACNRYGVCTEVVYGEVTDDCTP